MCKHVFVSTLQGACLFFLVQTCLRSEEEGCMYVLVYREDDVEFTRGPKV
jgi:hypothetical protein